MRYFLLCAQAILFFAAAYTHTYASAEDIQKNSEVISTRLIVAHLDGGAVPGTMEGYLLLEDGRWISGKGAVLRQNKTPKEESHSIWVMQISSEGGEVAELVISEERAEGDSRLYQIPRSNFFIAPIENSEVVRARISLLRQQLEQLHRERKRLQRSYDTLQRDAQFIGQQDTIERLEKNVRDAEKDIIRIRTQAEDFRNEIRSLKAWPEPLDIRERKQAYMKDLRKLQEKGQL
jgi:hypothetical protein